MPSDPLPPSPAVAPAATVPLGSKASFLGLLAAFGALAFGWHWRKAGQEDWAAGALVFAALPAALTWGRRWTTRRKSLAGASAVCALICWARYALHGQTQAPALEAAIFAGLGASGLLACVYLGQWGQDKSEAAWARILGPCAGLGLLASALTWTMPDGQPWRAELMLRGRAWWEQLVATGGGWRWLGTIGVLCAMGAAADLKIQSGGKS